MSDVLVIILIIVCVLALSALIAGIWRFRTMRSQHRSILESIDPSLTSPCIFFGRASGGKQQDRAMGALALSDTEVVFVRMLPAGADRLQRADIRAVATSKHFLGQTTGRDLLVISYEVEGREDSVAFDLKDPGVWLEELR